jgi:predicted MFS family arabinose efflux permease
MVENAIAISKEWSLARVRSQKPARARSRDAEARGAEARNAEARDRESRHAIIAAACAVAVGVGIARLVFAPLLPILVDAHWLSRADAGYVGAANFVGYAVGAIIARRLVGRGSPAHVLRVAMLGAAVSLVACGLAWGAAWMCAWRLVSGVAGGMLMVIAPPTALHGVPANRRGRVIGAMFAGVGTGVIVCGMLLPVLAREDPRLAWWGVGAAAAVIAAFSWRAWPASWSGSSPPVVAVKTERPSRVVVSRFQIGYGLDAIVQMPYSLFLIDYATRDLAFSREAIALAWVSFGTGAVLGPLIFGRLADGVSGQRGLMGVFVAHGIATLAAASMHLAHHVAIPYMLVAVIGGACIPGIVPFAIARATELGRGDPLETTRVWGGATTAFALAQAAVAYGFGVAYGRGVTHPVLFMAGGLGAFVAAGVLHEPAATRIPSPSELTRTATTTTTTTMTTTTTPRG